jgi:DNA uptake protein ComE-like DNA-binding protein
MHTHRSFIDRRTVGATTLLLIVAACSSGSKDARTDSASAAAAGSTAEMQSGASVPNPGAPIVDSATAAPAASASGATATSGTMLDPNSATKEQLAAVPGMTAAAADAIVAGRPYQDMLAVDQVLAKSIPSAETRKTVYAKVWKPIDLNTAKGDEILLIPGIGKRMQHEFEEYRPYKSIDQFRREIGKYVDKAEVARLEQYVTIR